MPFRGRQYAAAVDSMSGIAIRAGDESDVPALLAMGDSAVDWLVRKGLRGQWGTTPWTQDQRRQDRVLRMVDENELWLAEVDSRAAGALILADRPPAHVAPVGSSELYIALLLTAREFAGRGIGRALLEHARRRARERRVVLLRLDCWAGGDGKLVDYYRAAGFTPTVAFEDGGWTGQVLEHHL